MFEPVSLGVGAAATLLSSLFNKQAQDKVDDARNTVTAAERTRQAGLDVEADALNRGAQDRYAGFEGQRGARATQLADLFRAPVTTPTTPIATAVLPGTTSGVVQREIDTKKGIASDYVDHQADTLGNLRSFGDLLGGISRDQAHDGIKIGQLGSFKKGSAGVETVELDNANRAGNEKKMWADILGGVGKIGLTAGLAGAFAPAAAAAGGVAGAPLSILPAVAQTAPSAIGSMFAAGASPYLNYGVT